MVLSYKFKKEKLENGINVSRPKIFVRISGDKGSIDIPALIDSGCDTTVIPQSIAKIVGLNLNGEKDKVYGHHESSEVIITKANITFLGKVDRESIILNNIPVLVVLPKEHTEEEEEIVLGIDGIFDAFDITFRKLKDRIIFKKINEVKY